ncbi:cholinesterase 1-like [Homarus americanus]|uniref:cholinesterase 1-like n=1 Tax=Homarus americanus TaxID=6706 RepID=UPI001C437B98|nr:cholinesterase 1-like [Homarus americanus]
MRIRGLVLGIVLSLKAAGSSDAPAVLTEDGWVTGVRQRSASSRALYAYQGIPFAKPPVGDLRFKDPVPSEPWEGVRDGTKLPEPCLQVSFFMFTSGVRVPPEKLLGVEDCLYLNVYTPVDNGPKADLPVMVWIHGGAYFSGSTKEYLPLVILDHDVVLVVIQYRLGVLGFLSTEDSVIPGNFGLKDQTLALKWVQRNINNFGGDKTKVTIFGESAGGASVHFHMLSPKSKGLFSRVIMQSGTAISNWAIYEKFRELAEEVGVTMKCPAHQGSQALLSCLQKVDARQLASLFPDFMIWWILPVVFTPRVDGDYLPDEPAKLILEGRYNKVDLLAGHTSEDGALCSMALWSFSHLRIALEENFTLYGPEIISMTVQDKEDKVEVSRQLYQHYLGDDMPLDEDHAEDLTQLFTDIFFAVPHDLVTQQHARHGLTTYRYVFGYRGEVSFSDNFDSEVGKHWVPHVDDLYYIFSGGPLLKPHNRARQLTSTQDLKMRSIMSKMWTNFAATGNPTPDGSLGFTWEPATEDNLHYASLVLPPVMKPDRRQKVREFHASLPTKLNALLNAEVVDGDEARQTPQREEKSHSAQDEL